MRESSSSYLQSTLLSCAAAICHFCHGLLAGVYCVCTNNGVVSELLADDFQGTSTSGERYNKADELREEKGPHSAYGCALDDARVRFFSSSSGEDVAIIYGSELSAALQRLGVTFSRGQRRLPDIESFSACICSTFAV